MEARLIPGPFVVLVGFSRSHSLSHFGSVETQSVPLFFFVLLLLAKLSHLGSAGRVSSMSYGQDGAHRTRGPVTYFFLICPLVFHRFLPTPFWPSFAKPFLKNTGPVRETTPGQHHRTNKERKKGGPGPMGQQVLLLLSVAHKHSEKPIFATVSPGLQSRSRRGRLREKPGYKSQCLCCSFFYL